MIPAQPVYDMESSPTNSDQDIFTRLEPLTGAKIAEEIRIAPSVKSYSFESSSYSTILKNHIRDRLPCLIKGCFESPQDMETTANTTAKIEQNLMGVRDYIEPMVWIEEKDRMTPLHFDNCDNQMLVLNGLKVFILYSPDEQDFLYHPWGIFGYMRTSKASVTNPDYSRFPKLKNTHPLIAVVRPGDMLYFPADWSHEVFSLDCSKEQPTFALNYWFPLDFSTLRRGRSPQLSVFLWTALINYLIKVRFSFLGQRSRMAKPERKYYKRIYSDDDVLARYVKNLRGFLDLLQKSRKQISK